MKKAIIVSVILGIGVVLAPIVRAQEMTIQTDDSTINRVREQCDTLTTTLRRIHTNDALLRVNIGQAYSGLSSQFMARLNSRLALNRIDSTNLMNTTNLFEEQRSEFTKSYTRYEATLASLLKIDCRSEPVKFYAGLLAARDERAKLSSITQSLNGYVREYQVSVEDLQQSLRSEVQNGD